MIPVRKFCLLCLFATVIYGQSKTEIDLKNRLIALEAELASAQRERNSLSANLAKLQATSTTGNKERITQSATAARDAQLARFAADAAQAQLASITAAVAEARLRADTLQKTNDKSTQTLLITQFFGFLVVLVGLLYKGWGDSRARRWAREDEAIKEKTANDHRIDMVAQLSAVKTAADVAAQSIVETKTSLKQLEKNTDGIKDALVKKTAEAEYAKGLKAGTEGNPNANT